MQYGCYLCLISIYILLILSISPLHALEANLDDAAKLLAEKLYESLPLLTNKSYPVRVAIIPFEWDKEDQWALCRIISELLRSQIARKGGIELISKEESLRAMATLKLSFQKGLIQDDRIPELRKLLNCDLIVTGCATDLHTIININIYIWDAFNKSLITTGSVQVRKTAAIVSLFKPSSGDQEIYSMRWRSERLPYRILAMTVADIDGDKISDLLVLTESDIKVLSWDGFSFFEKINTQYIDAVQLRRNQRDMRIMTIEGLDLYVSVPGQDTTIWRWQDDSIIKTGSLPSSILVNREGRQIRSSLTTRNYFSGQATYQTLNNDTPVTELRIPVDYYSIALGDVNSSEGDEYLLIDIDNRMRIYSKDMELLWQSDKRSFGNGLAISDLDRNGRAEIIGTSPAHRGTQDSVIIWEFDGNKYSKKWESQTIKGEVSAISIGDYNDDGVEELIAAIWDGDISEIHIYTSD